MGAVRSWRTLQVMERKIVMALDLDIGYELPDGKVAFHRPLFSFPPVPSTIAPRPVYAHSSVHSSDKCLPT